jgi:hypothetical protein
MDVYNIYNDWVEYQFRYNKIYPKNKITKGLPAIEFLVHVVPLWETVSKWRYINDYVNGYNGLVNGVLHFIFFNYF